MKINIEDIKDAVYEFEGLLELADLREDKVIALYPLMKKKLEVINALFNDVDLTEESFEEADETEENISVEEEFVEEDEAEGDPESEFPEPAPELPEPAPEFPEPAPELPEPESELPVHESEPESSEVSSGVLMEVAAGTGVKPAFCINDRFRFRRELFNNSDAEFNSAMDVVATMDDYEEAEDYFIGALGWDFENPEVMDFMAIIRNYFDK